MKDSYIVKNQESSNEQVQIVLQGQTFKQKYYSWVLIKLRERVKKKRPYLWKKNTWILHQDKAPAHNALSVKQFLANKRIPALEYPPYSPDLTPCNFYLFTKIKTALKRIHFRFVEKVKTKAADLLKGLASKELQHCFEQWKTRMKRCIINGGKSIEGDRI
ncbi:Hypothetical protein CINCED_3A021518 [Cinara cedri]|uniref:Transposase, type 1 n=1 Tax=Cinara cedri TaxID=506608 RepID=A0A5E4M106_9HEMI|nr:Hypothetical protein CINCED_3A021518 [Cinara cedri]